MGEQPRSDQDAQGSYIAQASGPGSKATVSHTEHVYKYETAPAEENNRRALLSLVRNNWIRGVLEPSRAGGATIALGLMEHPEAVAPPISINRDPDASPRVIPPSTQIAQVFDDASGRLFILGEPGSGKTTLLLELAEALLDRAARDPTVPLPVVVNLASWAAKRLPIDRWLIEALNHHYGVAPVLAARWVAQGQILPLLDGLDEAPQPHQREACVEAINAYRPDRGVTQLVVSCRTAEYSAVRQGGHQLSMQAAVAIQPLTPEQIGAYLGYSGPQLEGLRAALEEEPEAREFAQSPLNLSVMAHTDRDRAVDVLRGPGTIGERTRRLWENYVDTMLPRIAPAPNQAERREQIDRRGRTVDARYRREQTIRWLTWAGASDGPAGPLHLPDRATPSRLDAPGHVGASRSQALSANTQVGAGNRAGTCPRAGRRAGRSGGSWAERRAGRRADRRAGRWAGRHVADRQATLRAGRRAGRLADLRAGRREAVGRGQELGSGLFAGLSGSLFVGLFAGLVTGLTAFGLGYGLGYGLVDETQPLRLPSRCAGHWLRPYDRPDDNGRAGAHYSPALAGLGAVSVWVPGKAMFAPSDDPAEPGVAFHLRRTGQRAERRPGLRAVRRAGRHDLRRLAAA